MGSASENAYNERDTMDERTMIHWYHSWQRVDNVGPAKRSSTHAHGRTIDGACPSSR